MSTSTAANTNQEAITFNRNLLIGFSVSLILLILSAVASIISIQKLKDSTSWVNHTYEVKAQLEKVISTAKDAETGQRGYLLTRDDKFLEPYNTALKETQSAFEELRAKTADNKVQQQSCDIIEPLLTERLASLERVITAQRNGRPIGLAELERGKMQMDSLRAVIERMTNEEETLLNSRIVTMNRYSTFTPIFILLAAGLALITTVVFYFRVKNEFERGNKLQRQLTEKDEDISRRINLIQGVAGKISAGQYDIRVADEGADGLGNLSEALNRMAYSLEESFDKLATKEWLQTGLAGLNEKMIGEKNVKQLAEDILAFTAHYTGSTTGAFYMLHKDSDIQCVAGFGINPQVQQSLKKGEGLVGQSVQTGKITRVGDVAEDHLSLQIAGGKMMPNYFLALPLRYENNIVAVLELASLKEQPEQVVDFLQQAAWQIGIALQTAINRTRLQELLEETQAQSEELLTQHHELENMNTELEAQAQKLQASEEELRVQQEELLQANQELEERSTMLEEKNQTIAERNLEIQKRSEELAISTKYKSEFLANMSHELRTPLNSILLLSRLLSENNEENMNKDQVEYAEVIQSSGQGLLSLIDEILDLSKIEAGKMDLEIGKVTLFDVTSGLRALFAPLAREKNVELKIEVDPTSPLEIDSDKMRLEQILKNLLSNAFKFTAEGSVTLGISPAAKGWLKLSVADTGIGIAKEKQALIFEAFQQADGSTKRKFGGTGLGLSISRELARLLGGTLSLESTPDKGSTFTLEIPEDATTAGKQEERESARSSAEETSSNAWPEDRQPGIPVAASLGIDNFLAKNIPAPIPDDRDNIVAGERIALIVEDDSAFAKSLLDFTRKRGYKGVVSVRGDEALPLALKYHPTVVLLDIRLPIKSGWQVMEELKSTKETRHIPVHIMSSEDARRESLQRGAVDFISKPVAFEQMGEIFGKLEHVINKNAKKVLIVEENPKHAKALAQFFEGFEINSEIAGSVEESVALLQKKEVDCVILDMGIPDKKAYETLEVVKKNPGLENLPIIIFTGKSLSRAEEVRIKQYADSIVVKTAHSYRRMLDEVNLFLHLMEEQGKPQTDKARHKKMAVLEDVLRNKTILVADDDVRNIFSLSKSLEQHGVTVISATDGKEALRQLEANPQVDLVLMDMMMPEMDGYESTTRIRRNPRTKNLPVIAVTAKTMMGDREKCIEAGASDYISKPVDVDQLLSLLRVWLYEKTV